MTPEERASFITGKKVTSEYVMSSEMAHEMNQVFDNINTRIAHDVVQRFVDKIIKDRVKDVVIEESPNFFGGTKFTLELFVFNREELNELINSITVKCEPTYKRFTDEWGNYSDWRDTGEMGG